MLFLNVGGVYFVTSRETVRASPILASLADSEAPDVFVDRDPTHFRYILNWMRGVKCLPGDTATIRELLWEAEYYGLAEMMELLVHSEKISVPHVLKGIQDDLARLTR